ncbi:hypothetical protein FO519_002117 [Halicephalobus sp. NKZ332]|nr:hypothetical protein FO519_002117 [Halicephalobus sp. NKZ332]
MVNVEELQKEIKRLAEELERAEENNIQAAQLGLAIVKEKENLELRLAELQDQYDIVRTEAETTKKAFELFKAQHKDAANQEIDHEERLLNETAEREQEYLKKIASLEAELKVVQPQLERCKNDIERLQADLQKSNSTVEELEGQRRKLREEIKDLKQRDQSLQNDNTELEEQNVALEKQVSALKQAQIEFEALKMEVKRLYEDNQELANLRRDEEKLRQFSEQQVQDALAKAQEEREQRLALKKELEHLRNAEQLSGLNSFLNGYNMNDAEASANLKQMESSFISDGEFHFGGAPAGGSDLFSEIHGGLNDKVSDLEKEREKLLKKNEEVKQSFIQMLIPILKELGINNVSENMDKTQLKEFVDLALDRLKEKSTAGKMDKATEKFLENQKQDLRKTILLAGAKNARLAAMKDQMLLLGALLSQSYSEIIGKEEKNPQADHVAQIMQNLRKIAEENGERGSPGVEESKEDDERDTRSPRLLAIDPVNHTILSENFLKELKPKLTSIENIESLFTENDLREKLVESEENEKLLNNLNELVNIVRSAVDISIQQKMENVDIDAAELLQQNQKLKQLLNVKRDQVRALRQVLSTNKTSTESALASVREKYESEKKLKDEILETLRRELKQFKEDAATFASHRAMYTARCEELQGQVESLTEALKTADEEKKTLNSLLRMAIQQKLSLTQRLEDLEMDKEKQTYNKRSIRQNQPPQNRNEQVRAVRYPNQNSNPQQGSGTRK